MKKETLNEGLMKLYEGYEGYEKIDNLQPKIVGGTDESYLNNGYMTFEDFIDKVNKLV